MRRWLLLASALLALAGALHLLLLPLGPLDEPVLLVGARWVVAGAVPHVDFWSMSPPLRFYLLAGLFALASPTVLVGRLFHLLLWALACGMLLRRFAPPFRLPLAPLLLLALAPLPAALWWGALVPALLALAAYAHPRPGPGRALAAGLLTAWALLSKLNFGAYTLLALVFAEVGDRSRRLGRVCLLGLLPALALGVYAFFYRQHLGELYDQLLRFPALGLEPHRLLRLPPGPEGWFAGLSVSGPLLWLGLRAWGGPQSRRGLLVLVFGLVLAGVAYLVGREAPEVLPRLPLFLFLGLVLARLLLGPLPRGEAAFTAALALFSHYFLSRADRWHYGVLIPLWWGLLAASRFDPARRARRRWAAVALVALFSLPSLRLYGGLDRGFLPLLSRPGTAATLARLWGRGDAPYLMTAPLPLPPVARRLFPDPDELATARYVYRRTAPEEPVYVGVTDHSRVFMSPTRMYWILGRPAGVRHYMLEPGLTTEAPVQEAMIRDLEARGVRWVILRENVPGDPDFQRRAYQGAALLDRYLREHFQEVKRYGRYRVLTRSRLRQR